MSVVDEGEEEPAADEPPNPRRRWGGLVAVIAIFGFTGLMFGSEWIAAAVNDARGRTADAKPAPAFSLPELGAPERTVSLADRDGKPVVLNFWASWCVPCRKELPGIQRVAHDAADSVVVLGVNHLDQQDDALEFAAKIGVQFRSGYDPGGDVAQKFGLFGMPTTVFIDRTGRIVDRKTGEITEAQLRARIKELFEVAVPEDAKP